MIVGCGEVIPRLWLRFDGLGQSRTSYDEAATPPRHLAVELPDSPGQPTRSGVAGGRPFAHEGRHGCDRGATIRTGWSENSRMWRVRVPMWGSPLAERADLPRTMRSPATGRPRGDGGLSAGRQDRSVESVVSGDVHDARFRL